MIKFKTTYYNITLSEIAIIVFVTRRFILLFSPPLHGSLLVFYFNKMNVQISFLSNVLVFCLSQNAEVAFVTLVGFGVVFLLGPYSVYCQTYLVFVA